MKASDGRWNRGGRTALLILTICALTVPGCGDDDPAEPVPEAPVITVTGVEEGVVYKEAVTITISVDVGTFTAQLNGQSFTSGSTVSDIGTYVLVVDADNQGSTSREQVSFGITLGGARILILRMLDLGANETGGGGDAILVADSSSAGLAYALVDAGSAGAGGADSTAVAERLAALGVQTLEGLILTHAHPDHYYGIPSVLDGVQVNRFFSNGQVSNDNRYTATVTAAEAAAEDAFVVTEPLTFGLADPGSPLLTVLSPFPAFLGMGAADDTQLDEGSLGTWIAFGDFTVFLAGDGQIEANNRWRNTFPSLSVNADLLKVGHHGANDAIFNNGVDGASVWLNHTNSALALISANGISHPEQNAVTEIIGRGIETYCTSVHGEIVFRANAQGQYIVDVERNADQECVAGSGAALPPQMR